MFVYEGSQYSLSEIVLLAFSLDSPPTEGDRELRSGTVFDNVPKVRRERERERDSRVVSLNSHLTLWRVARGGSHAWPARVQVVSDDYVDLLVSLLWNVDSISSQAHLSGTRVQRAAFGCGPGRLRVGSRKHCGDWGHAQSLSGVVAGLILDRFYITAPLLKVAPAMLRPKLGAMFTRLVDLLTLTPPSLDTAVVYRLAHILYSILNVMPHAVRDIVAEYEEVRAQGG